MTKPNMCQCGHDEFAHVSGKGECHACRSAAGGMAKRIAWDHDQRRSAGEPGLCYAFIGAPVKTEDDDE